MKNAGFSKSLILIAALFAGLFYVSCTSDRDDDDSAVIARVGSEELTIQQAINSIPPSVFEADSTLAVTNYRQQWIRRQVLLREADRAGIMDSDYFKSESERIKNDLALQLLMERVADEANDVSVSNQKALQYYERHRSQFVLDERHLRFHHMIAGSERAANEARQELLRGNSWEDIVERHSVRKNYSLHNSTTYHPASSALEQYPAMRQFVGAIGVTEVSPVRVINGRYHFIQLLDDRAAGEVPDLEWALEQIQSWLGVEKRQKMINAFEQNLIRQAEASREILIFEP